MYRIRHVAGADDIDFDDEEALAEAVPLNCASLAPLGFFHAYFAGNKRDICKRECPTNISRILLESEINSSLYGAASPEVKRGLELIPLSNGRYRPVPDSVSTSLFSLTFEWLHYYIIAILAGIVQA